MTTMTQTQMTDALKAIAGGDTRGWKTRAAEILGVTDRTVRTATSGGGNWSTNFEQRVLAGLARTQVKSVKIEPTVKEQSIEDDLLEIAGEGAGWQQRAANATGLSVRTIYNVLEGAVTERSRIAIQTALSAVRAGGSRILGRQAGEWTVAAPETRARGQHVIGESIVTHIAEPVVVIHLTQLAGKTGFGAGSEGLVQKNIRWITQPKDRAEADAVVAEGLRRGYLHIGKQLDAYHVLQLRKAAEVGQRRGGTMTAEEAAKATYEALINDAHIITDGDIYATLRDRIMRERDVITKSYLPSDYAAKYGQEVTDAMRAWEKRGYLNAMLMYATRALQDESLDTPSSSMMSAALEGKCAPLADEYSARGKMKSDHDRVVDAAAEQRRRQLRQGDSFTETAFGMMFELEDELEIGLKMGGAGLIIDGGDPDVNAKLQDAFAQMRENELNAERATDTAILKGQIRAVLKEIAGL